MPAKKYQVDLSAQERRELEQMLRRGTHSGRKLTRVRILLKAAEGLPDEAIAQEIDTSVPTIERTRRRFGAERSGALRARPRPGKPPVLQEKGQARVIAEAWSPAPRGREHWTLQVLADRGVELGLAEACAEDTVRRVLNKPRLSPGSTSRGVARR
jgi:transposase